MSDINETRPQTPEHSDGRQAFFTSVGCMDGRVQTPVLEYGKQKFGVLYADTITEAGLVGLLSNNPSTELLDSIKKKILISVEKHHSKGIVVHGHQECAGNPVDDEKHKQDVLTAVEVIKGLVSGVEIIPLFITKQNSYWTTEEL